MCMKRAAIQVFPAGIVAKPVMFDNKAHDPLIFFPHYGASPGYPEVASLDEAVNKLEGDGYVVIIDDFTFNTGIYRVQWSHGPGGVGRNWSPVLLISSRERTGIYQGEDPYKLAFEMIDALNGVATPS